MVRIEGEERVMVKKVNVNWSSKKMVRHFWLLLENGVFESARQAFELYDYLVLI